MHTKVEESKIRSLPFGQKYLGVNAKIHVSVEGSIVMLDMQAPRRWEEVGKVSRCRGNGCSWKDFIMGLGDFVVGLVVVVIFL